MDAAAREIAKGERFAFGKNWRRFIDSLTDTQIEQARESLCIALGSKSLHGKRFLDAGCGSGLSSLAANRLGAEVVSFDFDPEAVRCATLLRERLGGGGSWKITTGSVLDRVFLESLGEYEIVYSWGVLHHTGAMWQALESVAGCVSDGGTFVVSIYNDQGLTSRLWRQVKRAYNRAPRPVRWVILAAAGCRLWGPTTLRDAIKGRPFETWHHYSRDRGMHPWRDVVDWVGGWPFEVAKPEEVTSRLGTMGFTVKAVQSVGGGRGCNEFVFLRSDHHGAL